MGAAHHAKGCICEECRNGVTLVIATAAPRTLEHLHNFGKSSLPEPNIEVPGVAIDNDARGRLVVFLP